jgi:hypothetical protein
MNEKKEKKLKRSELYVKILKHYGQKPAAKSPLVVAYFTTDHLRTMYSSIEGAKKCLSSKIR